MQIKLMIFRERIVNLRKYVQNKFHQMEEFKNMVLKIHTSNNEKIKLANGGGLNNPSPFLTSNFFY